MALYERRSSFEDLSRWRTQSPTGSERRKLSFNPVGEWTSPAVQIDPPVAAVEVSKGKRIAQVAVAVVYCLLAAGVVFGFAAIKPVLIEEGVYKDQCTKEELRDGVWVCYGQELRLNLMFTVAAVSTNVCALPVGTVLDRFGPRIASLVGCVFLFVGALFMAFAADLSHTFDAYIPGYLFLALGGPFVFISSFQLSNTFPQHSGLILALLTGAFDTSSAVFLIYRLIYQHTHASFNTKKFFLAYLVVPVLILIAQLTVMPGQSYKTVGELVQQVEDTTNDIHDSDSDISSDNERLTLQTSRREHRESVATEINTLLGSKNAEAHTQQEEAKAQTSGVFGAMHGKSVLQQITSPWWILITLFTVFQMLRINYFVATVRTQYTSMLHSHAKAVQVNDFFDIALPLGGVISVPFIGYVLDHTSTPFVLGLLVTIATAIGVFGLIEDMWAAYANIILFVIYRPLYYTAVSDYSAKVFGFETFGKVYGLIICLAGLSNFTQAALDALTHKTFGNDPRPVNALLLCLALGVGVVLVGFVWRKSVTMGKESVKEEAEEAEERLMPGANGERVNRPHGHETYGTA
ncbi:Putative major facilitator superfamily, MFS transporter superfamily [Septoria linicola]|uniref:Major facilitator superfamily, MFS transporter superfamily n=1 Tax=Septoria linicola TaxID=215465 RepID=A0A9Q9AM26_9PEZI|nr:Putative major facilitator superfamily, MFS transporter superfamily [Septoria linicola]